MEDIRASAGALSLKYQDAPLAGIADQPQRLCDFHLQPSWSEPTNLLISVGGFQTSMTTSVPISRSSEVIRLCPNDGQTGS
jgi:hypothetical protein